MVAVLEREAHPVYAFHEIVHNRHVVHSFEERGAIFVNEVAEVPEGACLVFSAHGVSPLVRQQAGERRLRVVDATCPLVTKVHLETRKAAKDGYDVLLVGHRGHDETVGTLGEVGDHDGRIRRVDEAGQHGSHHLDHHRHVAQAAVPDHTEAHQTGLPRSGDNTRAASGAAPRATAYDSTGP